MYQRVFYGKITHPINEILPDLDTRERIALLPAAAAALVMGVAPLLWLNAIDPAAQTALAAVCASWPARWLASDMQPE